MRIVTTAVPFVANTDWMFMTSLRMPLLDRPLRTAVWHSWGASHDGRLQATPRDSASDMSVGPSPMGRWALTLSPEVHDRFMVLGGGLRLAVAMAKPPPTNPPRSAVDWTSLRLTGPISEVLVRCPLCLDQRWVAATSVRGQIRRHAFVGRCQPCNRPPTTAPTVPAHPLVNPLPVTPNKGRSKAEVTCPVCRETRLVSLGALRHQITLGEFTGRCVRDNIDIVRNATRPPSWPEFPGVD
jgi:hypothetical protein